MRSESNSGGGELTGTTMPRRQLLTGAGAAGAAIAVGTGTAVADSFTLRFGHDHADTVVEENRAEFTRAT